MSGAEPKAGEYPLRIRLFGRTDVGQVREHNEDNFLVANLSSKDRGLKESNRNVQVEPQGLLLGVCDGMGGAAAGEVASQLAVDIIFEQMTAGSTPPNRDELARRMVHAIEYAGGHIFQEARADRSRRGMGTTSTIAVLADERIYFGQVGDSRAYLLREGELKLLTRDQSLVNQLIEAGQLTEEEAETFEHNNIILQALGTSETVQVDLTYADLKRGDQLMLCSDGLSGMIRNDEIKQVMLEAQNPIDACRVLVERANAAGGHDNITVIVAHVEEGPQEAPREFGYQKYTLPEPKTEDLSKTSNQHANPFADTGDFPAAPNAPVDEPTLSEEAANETRNLRVSHTMIGMKMPISMEDTDPSMAPPEGLAEAPEFNDEPDNTLPGSDRVELKAASNSPAHPEDESPREATGPGGRTDRANTDLGARNDRPKSMSAGRQGEGRSRHASEEERVQLPTDRLPPLLLFVLIISIFVLAGILGYLAFS